MLRRLELKDQWRCLDKGFWPDDFPSGSRTVIYGHNGSGKSTLSELLLALSEGECVAGVAWENEDKKRTNIGSAGANASSPMAVFTRKWVETNLSAFLDGESASAIVTLGKAAIDARDEEDRLVDEIDALHRSAKEAAKLQEAAADRVDKFVREVQDRIVSELRSFDYSYFTKNRFSVPKVADDLRSYRGDFPDSNAHAEALSRLGDEAPSTVPEVATPSADMGNILDDLPALLVETPTRVAIQELAANGDAQAWVERGIPLHEGIDRCLFCTGAIDNERRDQLARHFDESWLRIRSKANGLLSTITDKKRALIAWRASLPAAKSLVVDLQSAYDAAVRRIIVEVDDRVASLEGVETVLAAKAANPSATPEAPDCAALSTAMPTTVLEQAIAQHNEQAHRHAEATAERKQTVLHHLIGSQSEAFRELENHANELATSSYTASKTVELAEHRLDQVRQAQFTTKDMADNLTGDLARVYGKNHLTVAVMPDGKSYACRRGDKPATNLSDGERTTLSLLYFLRKLEDEQVSAGDPSQRIVVIDDPSSSLDREALFATHQWLIDRLKDFGQYVILTHDFSLLRLFIKSHKSAWGTSMASIAKGDANEARFPKVSFLEMYAAQIDGERRSRMSRLPRVLLKNTSEYAYLFEMVMSGIADPDDHERLFLLPNAARRVLEVFASYKAPHRTDFLQQLEVLVEAQEGEPFRDVYDFCNRFSHGEGNESVDVLDARAVHGQIRRCMEFLRAIDSEHFERMCKATDLDASILAKPASLAR